MGVADIKSVSQGADDYESVWTHLQGVEFEQGYADAGGVRTRFLHTGSPKNPGLILVHGFGSHCDVWIKNLEAHGKHFNTYAIDLMGTGFSDKPDIDYHAPVLARQVVDFMDAVGIDKASVVGTSMGSRVVARFAVDYPERTNTLTLVSPAGLYFDKERAARIIRTHIKDNDEATWEGAENGLRAIIREDRIFADIVAARQKVFQQPLIKERYKRFAVQHLEETANLSFCSEDEYRSISAPTMIVKGLKDSFTNTDLPKTLNELIPNSKLAFFEGSIHAPYFEMADEFNSKHLQFLLDNVANN